MGKAEIALIRQILDALTVETPDIMRSKMSGALGVGMDSVPKRVFPQYICNASGQGLNSVYGVHPHGWWRGGDVSFNPNTKSILTQTLVSTGGSMTFGTTGNATMYTPTAGRSLYITSLQLRPENTGPKSAQILDGDGGTARGRFGYRAGDELAFYVLEFPQAPMGPFATSVFFDGDFANTSTMQWGMQGFEEPR